VLLLFLTSVFSGILINSPVLAQYSQSVLSQNSSGTGNIKSSGNNVQQSSEQGEPAKNNALPSSGSDTWDFNNVSQWDNLAYIKGNKTRLIIGVDGSKPGSLATLERLISLSQATVVNTVSMGGKMKALVVELCLSSVPSFVGTIRRSGYASYVEPNLKVQAQFTPNDPYWNLQWGPQKIQADWAWNTTAGSSSILVAVVDTGIDYNHPDLAANYVPLGYDWVNNDSDPLDDFGHGTHCAGIIAGVLNNSIGIAGTAQVHIMGEKVLDSGGWGSWDWVANGIIHAADQGANIISMSLGGYGDSELVHDAVKYAYNAGVLLVAAAGNDATNVKSYPAAYDEVVAVAATDQSDSNAYFSNYGDWIELAAPGVNIYSTMPTYQVTMNYYGYNMNYDYMSGTSMACPSVVGVAALVWSLYPSKTRDWVRQWLRTTAEDLGNPGFDVYFGFGRVNARKAVELKPPDHDLIAFEWQTPFYVNPGTTATINATVLNFGATDEPNVTVVVLVNDSVTSSTTLSVLPGGATAEISLLWTPTVEGFYNVTLYVVPVLGETNLENNVLEKSIYVGFPIKAVVLRSYGNFLGQSIIDWQALTDEWYNFGNKLIYVDYTSLYKENITYEDIAKTQADVLIISCAAFWQYTDAEIASITRYVHEGHGLIATAGTLFFGVPNNNKFAALFGMNQTVSWTEDYTDLLHLLNTTNPILNNVPNPLVFPQVGAAVPMDGRWDSDELVGGKYLAIGHYQESAMVTYRGLVYISPWLEIIPPYYHHHLQLLYNAMLWSRYQKPAHDLLVSLEVPKYLQPGESALLNATVTNMGLNDETNVTLNLSIDGLTVNSTTVMTLPVGGDSSISYFWSPAQEKIYNLSAFAPPVPGEDDTWDNIASVMLYVRPTRFVLFDSSHDLDGDSLYGNYLFLDQLLVGNGFVVDELTAGPISSVLLSHYDILVLMDPELDFSPSEIADIHDWVLGGGGLFAIPDGGYPATMNTLLVPYGVSLTGQAGGYGMTSDVASHSITQGVASIYVDWVQEISVVSPSAPLAWITDYSRLGFLSASDDDTVVVLSDSNVMDNNGLEMADNTRLMLNIFNWVGLRPEHDLAARLEAPTFLEPNASTLLKTTVYNRGLNNETNVQLDLMINGTLFASAIIPELLTKESYTFGSQWTPTLNGYYNVTAYAAPATGEDYLTNNVAMQITIVRPVKHVLFDQVHGNDYIGNYGQWLTSLQERGYLIDTLSTYPLTPDVLENYDVFVVPSAYLAYTQDELSAVQNFVFNGGGLLVIGGYDSTSIFTDLTGFAGITWQYGGVSGITEDITPHPVTTGVKSVFIYYPSIILYWNGTAQSLVRDIRNNTMLAVSEQPSGKVMGYANEYGLFDYPITYADNMLLANNMMDWLSQPIRVDHDLAVSLVAPSSMQLNESGSFNFSLANRGLNNETNVELYLLINGTVVKNMVLPELDEGQNFGDKFDWTPTESGFYNVTLYTPSIAGETNVANNVVMKLVSVFYARSSILHEKLGAGTAMHWHADDGSWEYTLPFSFPFYGVLYSSIYVSSNGLVTFLGPDADHVHSISALAGKLAIAPAWFDWDSYDPYDIYIWQSGTYVGIRWQVEAFGAGSPANFEVVLSSEGVIQFNYERFVGHPPATVGISNGAGHLLAEDLSNLDYGDTIVFLPFIGERNVAVDSVNPSVKATPAGNPVNVAVTVENKGNFTENFKLSTYAIVQNTSQTSALMQPLETRVYLDPSEYNFTTDVVSVGYRFNVTFRVDNVADLYTWEVGVYFDGTILKATRWFEPTWDSEYVFFNETTLTAQDIGTNYALIGATLLSFLQEPAFNGSGKLCIIEFETTAVPQNGQTYSSNLNITNTNTFLDDPNQVDMPVIKENGFYELRSITVPGQYTIGTLSVVSLVPGEKRTLLFTWDTSGIAPGDYKINAEASIVPCETDTQDNLCYDGIVTVTPGESLIHDVAVTNVTGLTSFAYQGWGVRLNATVANLGNATENFTVTLYYDSTVIGTQGVLDLNPSTTITISFVWNTTSIPAGHNYTISAVASTVAGETNTTNNALVAGQIEVRIMGDLNGDGMVDMRDVLTGMIAFRSYPGRSKWNPCADLNRDGLVDMRDIVAIILNFRKHI
jgi:thermitase